MNLITRNELKHLLESKQDVKLVAVINPWRFRAKHIPGSVNFSSLEFILATIKPHEEVVLYSTGQPNVMSSWAYRLLEEHGYTQLWLYEGGINEWEAAGLSFINE